VTAEQLVRLYPRRWRVRYADEFVETVGPRRLHPQQVIDIVSGAIDAWISFDGKKAAVTAQAGGEVMVQQWRTICATNKVRYTTRDGLISAGVLLLTSLVLSAAGIVARTQGNRLLGDSILADSFPISLAVSMPFAVMKGQPKTVQTVVIGTTIAILLFATWLATKI
jgi:hypothetical protein